MDSELVLQEGGADAAEILLSKYDRETSTWSVEKAGEFWEAVTSAHALGRFGQGIRVAVVDAAFDMSIPALMNHNERFVPVDGEATAHGTVAALLALEVAPRIELDLYAISVGGHLQLDRAIEAVHDAVARGTDIINLSMGIGLRLDECLGVGTMQLNPSYKNAELEPDDWRSMFDIPTSPLWQAAYEAVGAGVTVIASAGNHAEFLYVPAVVPHVISVGFQAVEREIDHLMEKALSANPTYSQSIGSDLLIVQPPDVLGSSFACPLVAGFAALMEHREELPRYIACVRRSANASGALTRLSDGLEPDSDAVLRVDSMLKRALKSAPHAHYEDVEGTSECPECALFAAPAFIDFGLFALNTANLDVAAVLLSAARRFAPTNVHAAADLGVTYGAMAQAANEAGDTEAVLAYLLLAVEQMTDAVRLRPDHGPYENRLIEFQMASLDPTHWTMAP